MVEVLWGIFSWAVVLFIFYALAHTFIARPIIHMTERAIGREWFPFLDRVWPR